ncbi:SDR family NAD(P)-dependent oxidoreductase [Flavobacterium silvaticum]|uniref:SDR family NAD(P)-dependent oxidoreductase n=1 Tax=Flavobacterium silvaticum TaxID=1852020 RepID=A0A972FLG8_9FLAO|nr:SDR family NAD(P)-dependent oxidoreductase [Flavobacterium silvaticum]NMH28186.1 SDR family NAD(P)-dependent oxidoreductase [Flavobacterium silvaticum]
MEHTNQQTWFVTGASKGLGLSLVKQLLAAGHSVAATSRDGSKLASEINDNPNFLALETNLASRESIFESINKAISTFGKIDVLVNNAGYGIGGSLEEVSEREINDAFDINLHATINTIAAVLPSMRQNRSGHIINISSIAGFNPGIGWPTYAAVKAAVFGLTEGLSQDVAEFGIKATVVAPGAFRTEFLTGSSLVLSETKLPEYTAIRESHKKMEAMDGKQQGDPEKAVSAIIELGKMENPPVHLFLGSDAYRRATLKIEQLTKELEDYKTLTLSTDF